ncbi:septation protein A [Emcibacter sp. SYSU 3D8]|uniref:septation protein A n=1 Tax=Emcibacter sp. SYSU 3D8 TaxID=3133969 RepID=UPI0031FF2751
MSKDRVMGTGLKLLLDMGPLVVFFAAYFKGNIYIATGTFMAATVAAIIVYWLKVRHVPMSQIITLVIVLVFGGLTLALDDPRFIKMKPTMIYVMFSAILFGGLATGRSLLKVVFEAAFPPLTETGWRILTVRWAIFFAVLAVLNEAIWRNFSEEFWVSFKLFGFLPLTMVFAMAQLSVMNRHAITKEPEETPSA